MKRLLLPQLRAFSQFKHEFAYKRKPKTKVIEKYEALAPWDTIKPKDPFDYPLRSKESVREYQRLNPPDFPVSVSFSQMGLEVEVHEAKARAVYLAVNLDEMRLTPKMQQRLIFLLGDRYKPDWRQVRIRVDSFADREHNYERAVEILKEMYFEALRAP